MGIVVLQQTPTSSTWLEAQGTPKNCLWLYIVAVDLAWDHVITLQVYRNDLPCAYL